MTELGCVQGEIATTAPKCLLRSAGNKETGRTITMQDAADGQTTASKREEVHLF